LSTCTDFHYWTFEILTCWYLTGREKSKPSKSSLISVQRKASHLCAEKSKPSLCREKQAISVQKKASHLYAEKSKLQSTLKQLVRKKNCDS